MAIGPHLHFEVRVENPYDYRETRNPELWFAALSRTAGLIIGFAHDEAGEPVLGKRLVARSTTLSREVFTYGSALVNGDPVWGENFVISDLPAGSYEIVVLNATGNIAYRNKR